LNGAIFRYFENADYGSRGTPNIEHNKNTFKPLYSDLLPTLQLVPSDLECAIGLRNRLLANIIKQCQCAAAPFTS